MNDGNEVYESRQLSGLLSADEVLALQPSLGVKMAQEMFVYYDQLASVVRELVTESYTCHNYRSGCILVITPYSFSICCVGEAFILFDSHMHLASGALLARVSAVHAEHYLMHFFCYYYPRPFQTRDGSSSCTHYLSPPGLVSRCVCLSLPLLLCFVYRDLPSLCQFMYMHGCLSACQ